MTGKVALALSILLSNTVLELAGFEAPSRENPNVTNDQPQAVGYVLRALMGLVPLIFTLISCVFVYFYPISKEQHAIIKSRLEEQRRTNAAKPPPPPPPDYASSTASSASMYLSTSASVPASYKAYQPYQPQSRHSLALSSSSVPHSSTSGSVSSLGAQPSNVSTPSYSSSPSSESSASSATLNRRLSHDSLNANPDPFAQSHSQSFTSGYQ